MKKLQQNTDS